MEEQRVNFETAVLAKEKGFKLPLSSANNYWIKDGSRIASYEWFNLEDFMDYIDAPTQSLLQKWLREEHNIDVLVDKGFLCDNYSYEIYHKNDMIDSEYIFKTFEKALEAGLYEALKLI